MSKSKFKNYQTQLVLFLLGNFILMGLEKRLIENISFDYQLLIKVVPFSVVAVVISYVLNGLVPSEYKAKLVFLRWTYPMPGTRLLKTISEDFRFSSNDVIERFGPIPIDPKEQNIYWYNKIYKPVQHSDKVREVQWAFLLTRDLTAISACLIIISIANVLFLSGSYWFIVVMFFEFFFIRLSAANYGKRFVCTCIAEGIGTDSIKSMILVK